MSTKTTSTKGKNGADNANNAETSTPKIEINEREYMNRYLDMKDKLKEVLTGKTNYVSLMTTFFPKKYAVPGDEKAGRNLLRRVYNGQIKNPDVLADFEQLHEKIKSIQQ